MSSTAPLSPAEAVVMLRPNLADGLRAIKVTLLLLLTRGVLRIEETGKPGLFGVKKIAHLRIVKEPPDSPYDTRAVLDLVRAAQTDGGRIADVVKRAKKDWGASAMRFVTELVRPALITRGLISERQLMFIRTYHPTTTGEPERARLEAELAKAREIPHALKHDPARAAAIAAAIGTTILLDDACTKQFKPLADAMRSYQPAGDVTSTGSFDFGGFDLGAFDASQIGSLDSGIASFDAGFSDGGGGGGDGGGGGADSS
jgi:hypothetical protein